MAFFDDLDTVIDSNGRAIDFTGKSAKTQDYAQEGFQLPPIPAATGNGLPSNKTISSKIATFKRSLIHWLVPEFGIIKMYINPASIQYSHNKLIHRDRTKGGYTLQYWGEDLSKLTLQGTTGSSGIEGMNVLYEIYRAEQYAFDAVGLTLSAANQNASSLATSIGSAVAGSNSNSIAGEIGGGIADALLGGGVASSQSIGPKNIPSLASFAFSVEMFYQGSVHRGFFNSMTITESVQQLGMFEYSLEFYVTEKRGYRTNFMPWHKSAKDGPSGDAIPYTFSTLKNQ